MEGIDFGAMSDEQFGRIADLMVDEGGRVDLVMHMFGVARCADTWVGNAMVRGVSGGERKRMSTVEMLMGHQRVYILDEISTGLVCHAPTPCLFPAMPGELSTCERNWTRRNKFCLAAAHCHACDEDRQVKADAS
jgi:hypothetical protein